MLSERTYWIVLIFGLALFCAIDWLLIVPIERDLGVNLFASAIFTVFTIVFLTWAFRIREINEWKLVENRVRKKIADRLQFIARTIYKNFLFSREDSDFREKTKASYRARDIWNEVFESRLRIFSETSGQFQNTFVEYFANQKSVKFLPDAFFLRAVRGQNTESLLDMVRDLRESAEFLDGICRDFRTFLPPKLVHGIMGIGYGLDSMIYEVEESARAYVRDPSKIEIEMLQRSIHQVLKELDKLNKMKLGFYPRLQSIESGEQSTLFS